MKRAISVLLVCALAMSGAPAMSAEDEADAKGAPQLNSILGREVTTLREGDGGRIVDVLVDDTGRLRAAVVEFGGFLGIGTRKIAVDWSAFRFTEPTITVAVSRDQLRAAPEFKPNTPPFVIKSAQQ